AIVEVDDQQAVVERLEDVLVESAHAIELERLQVQLTVEPRVLDRGGNLTRHGSQQRHVLTAQRLACLSAAEREDSNRAFLGDAGHEVVQAGIAPELDLLG